MDDIFDMLESDEKAFQQPAAQTQQETKNTYTNNFNKPKKVSLWDSEDIKPVKISVSDMSRSKKTFGVFLHSVKEPLSPEMEERFINFAKALFTKGYTFRYNGDKSDQLALKIVALPNSKVDCYLPWKKYNEEFMNPVTMSPSEKAYGIAFNSHGRFMKLPPSVRAILSRDIHVMLGKDCNDPLNIALIYNLDGSETVDKKTDYKQQGNTTFVLRVTGESDIPVFNLKTDNSTQRLIEFIKAHTEH
jgi:hypothetical protein